jgi:hypothetical protein
MTANLLWTLAGFILTLMIFSYLLGDNFLFRLATYIFIGVASGVVVVTVIYQVILPRLVTPLMQGDYLTAAVPLLLGVLLFIRFIPRMSRVASLPMAYLVGAGVAVTIGGAILGTIFGQARATFQLFDMQAAAAAGSSPALQLLEGIFVLFGVIATLLYFSFSAITKNNQPANRPAFIDTFAGFGKIFIAIILGAVFAGVFSAALTALIERLDFLRSVIMSLL